METIQNEWQHLSVDRLIDLLIARAADLIKASDREDRDEASRIGAEIQELHKLIKAKRSE